MQIWKFNIVDLSTFEFLETVEAEVDDSYGIQLGLEEAAKKVVKENQKRFPALIDCDPNSATQ
jgi:hypothetical protein